MFVVLVRAEEPENRWQRLRRRMAGTDLRCEEKSFYGNRYLLVTWYGGEEAEPPWGRIAGLTDRPRLPTLLPPGVPAPPGCPMRAYEPLDFEARLTVTATRSCLAALPQEVRRGTVGIIDPAGIAPWAAAELAPCCRGVKVYSLRPERYRRQEEWLLGEGGVALQYAAVPQGMADCVLCAAPYPTGVLPVACPVITGGRSGVQGRPTVNRLTLCLPQELLREIPPGVAPERFLGMVTEAGQHRLRQEWEIVQCRIDGRLAPFGDLAKMVRQQCLT